MCSLGSLYSAKLRSLGFCWVSDYPTLAILPSSGRCMILGKIMFLIVYALTSVAYAINISVFVSIHICSCICRPMYIYIYIYICLCLSVIYCFFAVADHGGNRCARRLITAMDEVRALALSNSYDALPPLLLAVENLCNYFYSKHRGVHKIAELVALKTHIFKQLQTQILEQLDFTFFESPIDYFSHEAQLPLRAHMKARRDSQSEEPDEHSRGAGGIKSSRGGTNSAASTSSLDSI